ncbi:MAG: hypothetical protein IJV58_00365 [Oscillospiraceae bacterium]|nr:hypothetical protein [Oscillospiraceae bacterium]
MKRSQKPQTVAAVVALGFELAYACTGFTHLGLLILAWVALLVSVAFLLDYEEWLLYLDEIRADREAVDTMLECENFEIWCRIYEERQRRLLLEELGRITDKEV